MYERFDCVLYDLYSDRKGAFSPPAQDQKKFVRTSKYFNFYLELYKNKFKNLILTSKFKFSFRGLGIEDQFKWIALRTKHQGLLFRQGGGIEDQFNGLDQALWLMFKLSPQEIIPFGLYSGGLYQGLSLMGLFW